MSYATVEAGVATVIKKLANYSTTNVSQDDVRVLANGVARAAILSRGGSSREPVTLGITTYTIQNTWITTVYIYVPMAAEYATTKTNLDSEVDAVLAELAKWPNLAGVSGVFNSLAEVVSEPEIFVQGINWLRTVMEVVTMELVDITRSE